MTSTKKVEFTASVYKKSHAFNIPKHVRDKFGIHDGDSIRLIVRTPSGNELFNGRKTLKSGPEIYGKDIAHALAPGSTILVEVSEPIFSEAKAEAESFDAQEREAGFQSNPKIRRVVEDYAMALAKEELSSAEFKFSNFNNTSGQKCYDYTCERSGSLYYVEVKGTQGAGTSVILTKNEVEHWKQHQQHSIAVIVHDIKLLPEGNSFHPSGGVSRVCLPWVLESAALTPIQYKWSVS